MNIRDKTINKLYLLMDQIEKIKGHRNKSMHHIQIRVNLQKINNNIFQGMMIINIIIKLQLRLKRLVEEQWWMHLEFKERKCNKKDKQEMGIVNHEIRTGKTDLRNTKKELKISKPKVQMDNNIFKILMLTWFIIH